MKCTCTSAMYLRMCLCVLDKESRRATRGGKKKQCAHQRWCAAPRDTQRTHTQATVTTRVHERGRDARRKHEVKDKSVRRTQAQGKEEAQAFTGTHRKNSFPRPI